jgi:hypothetical protein
MKSYLAVIAAVVLFLIPAGAVAGGADEVHAYALALETFTAPSVFSCPTNQSGTSTVGWIWIARNVIFLGPGVGTSGLDSGDVTVVVCNGDTPQRIRERLTDSIQQLAADRGYAIKPINIVVPTLQQGS